MEAAFEEMEHTDLSDRLAKSENVPPTADFYPNLPP